MKAFGPIERIEVPLRGSILLLPAKPVFFPDQTPSDPARPAMIAPADDGKSAT
jgi:hypothetical protein